MKDDTLWTILESELKAKKQDDRWKLPSGTRITVFLKGPNVPFVVAKVTSIAARADYLILDSDDGRVFTHLTEIIAVRADEEASSSSDSRLGFS